MMRPGRRFRGGAISRCLNPMMTGRPGQETKFKVVFDRENIYIAFRAFDTAPDSIVSGSPAGITLTATLSHSSLTATMTSRPLLPFLPVQPDQKWMPMQPEDGENMDDTWNPVWWTETQIDDKGLDHGSEDTIQSAPLRQERIGSMGAPGSKVCFP